VAGKILFVCALDEKHLYAAVRYVENNPVKAGVVKKAEDYACSSGRRLEAMPRGRPRKGE
jgi:hypothetical protein